MYSWVVGVCFGVLMGSEGKAAHCPERTRDATQPAMIVVLGLVTKEIY